ncbi:MAG: serine/threonine-protein kinase [Labilithrix sp.]
MALEPAKLSDFKLAGSLGSGATARVYEATQTATGRPVAIKMMEDSGSTAEMRERFAREAILLSGVQSRHVSKILGFGFEKGQPFLVLEKLAGETLDAKLRRDGPPTPPVAVKWIEQLIIGIRDCHDAKVIHRDIKPSNIFLHHDGQSEMVKVIDFGVARLREIADDGSGALTSANHLIGSMGYMAPEQFTNAKGVHFTADLYAIGVVVFRTLTGRLPFVSRSLHAVIKMKSEQPVPTISTMPGMPKNALLDWFVQKSTARDPNARFKSAREMLDHWRNVMASFEEGGTTEISRRVPPVPPSESPASSPDREDTDRMRSSQRLQGAPPSTMPHTQEPSTPQVSTPRMLRNDDDGYEDRTIHKPNRFPPPSMPPPATAFPVSSGSERTIQRAMAVPLAADQEEAPHTVRQPDETVAFMDASDPFDLPTKSDPNLRKLVERELALQKARKEQGK